MKKAFTLIELIITIVILGIVAYIATDLIAKTFINYNRSLALQRTNLKVEIALNEITNRLENAVPNTIVKRKSANDNSLSLIDIAPSDYEVLEWIGKARDSFQAIESNSNLPGWSGFCNIKKSFATKIYTPGSKLDFANDIIQRLSNDQASLTNSTVALLFPENYEYNSVGYNGGDRSGLSIVTNYSDANASLDLDSNLRRRITEKYYLAWTAYAIVPDNCSNGVCDLYLRYNFRPWKGNDYDSSTAKDSNHNKLLATNVSVFKTYATQNRIHIKLCVREKYGFGANNTISICKEEVVFR